jgi:hypothetical protein
MLAVSAGNVAGTTSAGPLRLIMVDAPGCRFCLKWTEEIGPSYPKSEEGRRAPLTRVGREASEIAGFAPVIYTPTFILTRDGHEVGRIAGYPGAHYFWVELAELIDKADAEKAEPARGTASEQGTHDKTP